MTPEKAAQIVLKKIDATEVITIRSVIPDAAFRGRLDCGEYELLRLLAQSVLDRRDPMTDPELGVFKKFTDSEGSPVYVRQTSIDSFGKSDFDPEITAILMRGGKYETVKETVQEVIDILKEK